MFPTITIYKEGDIWLRDRVIGHIVNDKIKLEHRVARYIMHDVLAEYHKFLKKEQL